MTTRERAVDAFVAEMEGDFPGVRGEEVADAGEGGAGDGEGEEVALWEGEGGGEEDGGVPGEAGGGEEEVGC